MKINRSVKQAPIMTHEGGKAVHINAELQLRRTVMACLLWEDQFYESGVLISERISKGVLDVPPIKVAKLAVEAREQMKLRHAPLLLVREMARRETHRPYVAETLAKVIQRADELTEFLAIYWKDGKSPLAHCVRRGLDLAIRKFDEYALAKYDRDGAIKLRDVFRLIRPIPSNEEQSALWKRAVTGELATPDTWEVELSKNDGVSKKDKWTRLLKENKLGALALLRNLRNMEQAGVDTDIIRLAIAAMSTYRVLPFRFIAAARFAPHLEDILEQKLFKMFEFHEQKLSGKTVIVVDVSGSMQAPLSGKSDMTRNDAAYGVAMVGREMFEDVEVYSFSDSLVAVPNRRGFALRDAIHRSQGHGSTNLAGSLAELHRQYEKLGKKYDRIIVITDEQSQDGIIKPLGRGYVVNVGSYTNGVGYGSWTHIDGFSEAVFRYIVEIESNLQ